MRKPCWWSWGKSDSWGLLLGERISPLPLNPRRFKPATRPLLLSCALLCQLLVGLGSLSLAAGVPPSPPQTEWVLERAECRSGEGVRLGSLTYASPSRIAGACGIDPYCQNAEIRTALTTRQDAVRDFFPAVRRAVLGYHPRFAPERVLPASQ